MTVTDLRARETHLKFFFSPGVSGAFNAYSHINGTLRRCNHGNRHRDYVKQERTKDPKMPLFETVEEKRKENEKRRESEARKEKAMNTFRAARAGFSSPAE